MQTTDAVQLTPPPLPVDPGAKAFDRAYAAWRADVEAGCPVETAPCVFMSLLKSDLPRLLKLADKILDLKGAGFGEEMLAMAWRLKVTAQIQERAAR